MRKRSGRGAIVVLLAALPIALSVAYDNEELIFWDPN